MRSVPVFWRRALMLGWDVLAWLIAFAGFVLVRYEFQLKEDQWLAAIAYAVAIISAHVVLGFLTQLYLGRSKVGSYAEATYLGGIVLSTSVVLGLVATVFAPRFPNAIAIFMPATALILMAAGRWAFRGWLGANRRRNGVVDHEDAKNVLVYGAGEAGAEVARLVNTAHEAPYRIVGFIDDDRSKRFLRVHGHRVLGTRSDLVHLAKEKDAHSVILAMGNAQPDFIKGVSQQCSEAGVKLIVIPPVRERIGGRVQLDQLREFDVVDLLGRRPIHTDLSEISGYLSGRVVLVTGAGGSIGAEIARQVNDLKPSKLFLLDRDESALHGLQLDLKGVGLLDSEETILCDIRDETALQKVFDQCRPDVVLHAAALKHLPMLERFPEEGWKTNVLGSLNVLRCARKSGVQRFVNVSTDKAADAISRLGQSKRLAERLTAWYAMQYNLDYVSVRFGNVLGSRGSVVHAFKAQIERGGPVTVTDPKVTRYFMTIPEACELVLQAGAIGKPGDVLVLDMGEPVRILDVAQRLIEVSGRHDIAIQYTGLREGEKLHEVLLGEVERGHASEHPLITQVAVPVLSPMDVLFDPDSPEDALELMRSQAAARLPQSPVTPVRSDLSADTGSHPVVR
ncbi:nucleoside-diphosphate sugar epimerase/dehydratase [Ammonicoccus fulvus]|uniref:Nucleoside-diphosphate sugar epimerase/dehydratase n=1 Tax=Ammonicoccus fulvus TaxID=3138240 RepID=A0ABZ3FNP4_9ACTN